MDGLLLFFVNSLNLFLKKQTNKKPQQYKKTFA